MISRRGNAEPSACDDPSAALLVSAAAQVTAPSNSFPPFKFDKKIRASLGGPHEVEWRTDLKKISGKITEERPIQDASILREDGIETHNAAD